MHFPATADVRAADAGEIADLNVMTRRGRFQHRLMRIAKPTSCDFCANDIALVLSLDGRRR